MTHDLKRNGTTTLFAALIQAPKPLVWMAEPEAILAKLKREDETFVEIQ